MGKAARLRARPADHHGHGGAAGAAPSFILIRGNYDAARRAGRRRACRRRLSPWPAGAPHNRLGLAQWFIAADASAHRARGGESLLGAALRHRPRQDGRGFRLPERMAEPPGSARLARARFRRWRLGREGASSSRSSSPPTYRQSSAVDARSAGARDPENRLLARGPRLRLPAELIRDQALAVSGLLAPARRRPQRASLPARKLYEGVVVGADYPGTEWEPSKGEDLYRRSLYTFWKRTVPPPAMLTFDAPDREFCIARRSRTNTPLQALLLLERDRLTSRPRACSARACCARAAPTMTAAWPLPFASPPAGAPPRGGKPCSERALEAARGLRRAPRTTRAPALKVGASPVDRRWRRRELAACDRGRRA